MQKIEERPVVIPKATIDLLLKQKDPASCIGLYTFYYYTAIWQQTNTAKAVTKYAAKGLHWNKDKVVKIKKVLSKTGLITDIVRRDDEGKITGHYIQVNYYWSLSQLDILKTHIPQNPVAGLDQGVVSGDTNACSSGKENACSSNILTIVEEHLNSQKADIDKSPNLSRNFEVFWKSFPIGKKYRRDLVVKIWYELNPDETLAELIIKKAKAYAIDREGEDPKYTTTPANWLQAGRWTDEYNSEAKDQAQAHDDLIADRMIFDDAIKRGIIPPDTDFDNWLKWETPPGE